MKLARYAGDQPVTYPHPHCGWLKPACYMRGISQTELARASGISQAFISKIEDFGKLPGEDTLEKISCVPGLPRNFFFRPGRILDLPAFHFRKRAKLATRPLAKIKAVANIQQQHVEKLLQSYEMENVRVVPHIDLDETGLNPEKVAEYLRQYWLVERGLIRNIVELIEEAGGIIIFSDFETKLFDGLSLRQEGMPPVFLMNKNVPGDRLRFSLAHELGHMMMHNEPDSNKKEKERGRNKQVCRCFSYARNGYQTLFGKYRNSGFRQGKSLLAIINQGFDKKIL